MQKPRVPAKSLSVENRRFNIALGELGARAVRNTDPFNWSVVEDFFDRSVALSLSSEFPADGFRMAGSQIKKFYVRSLVVNSTLPSSIAKLSATWQNVALFISSPDYRKRLGEFFGRDLNHLRVDATLCRYAPGCSLPPHTDRDVRDTTHVIYFNREWYPDWGGLLQVLRSERPNDVVSEVVPKLNISVVMVRSDRSWHSVSPVAAHVDRERLSLLIHTSSGA
jgi:SM-20-related protein